MLERFSIVEKTPYDLLEIPASIQEKKDIEFEVKEKEYLLDALSADSKHVWTLVFDLDETLVWNREADKLVIRPGAIELLRYLRTLPGIEIVLWTASKEDTAIPVVDKLQEEGDLFDAVIVRDLRWYLGGLGYVKALAKLGRNLSCTLIVEDTVERCKLNPGNALIVKGFLGEKHPPEDQTIPYLRAVLTAIDLGFRQNLLLPELVSQMGRFIARMQYLEISGMGGVIFWRVRESY